MHRPSFYALVLTAALLCACAGSSRPAVGADDVASVAVGSIGVEPKPVEEPGAPESGIPAQPEAEGEVAVPEQAPPAAEVTATQEEQKLEEGLEEAPTAGALPVPLEVPAPIVSKEIEGNVHVQAGEIEAAIKSQVGGQFSESQVAEDRRAILALGWFQRVSVERESVENGVRLIFRVVENPVVEAIEFKGNTVFTREQLLAAMKTKPGQVYNAPLIAQDAQAVEKLYQRDRYILAIVVGQSMSEEGVLTLEIAEGVIEAVKITGNTHTKTFAIRRYIRTKQGDVYNEDMVQRDVARLMAQGLFETVRRDAEVGTEPGTVIVVFTVVEKRRTGMVSVGGGYSSVQGLVGFIDLSKANLGGTGQVASIRAEFGGQTSYELGYQNPWVMTPETRLSLGIYDRLILREAFVTDTEGVQHNVLYDERRSGGNVTLGRPISDVTTIFLGLRADDVSIADVSADDEAFLTGSAFEPRKVRSITLAGVNDTRNDIYNPRRGGYDRLSAEFAGLLFGGTEFNKYVLDGRRYAPLGKRNALAFRLLTGVVTGDPPYLEQFLIGGSESLRGFRTDRFAGTKMAILNAEYRRPIGTSENLIGVLFVDVGDAWGGPLSEDTAFADVAHSSFEAHVGYGVGVRVKTPIGPLRLDLGFSEEGTETHFGVRNTF